MGDHIASRDLYLGDVYDNQGNLLKEYRTYRGREFVHLHGGKGSTRRLCKTCGRIGIYPMTPNWLTHASVGDRMIYETNFGLLLSEEIAKRIAGFRPKNFYLTKIRWRDKPVEGDHVPMDQGPVPQGPG